MKLLNLLFDHGVKNAMLIGDPDQSIYEWRDADPSVFLNMYNSKNWNSKELNENFRCSQHICNATKIFASLSETSIARGDTKDSSIKPIIMKYNKGNKDILIEKYLDLCKEKSINITPEKVAVLVRGRSGLNGKDYSKINELWQTPITFLLAQATYYKGIQNVKKTVSVIEKILYYIIFKSDVNVTDFKEIQKIYSIKEWNYLVFKLSIRLSDSSLTLKSWKQAIIGVVDRSFFADTYKNDYLSATIHAVKGCTFDAVMLIISTNGKLTSNMINQKEIDTEEIRTFYVAATRAKKLFVLAVPDTIKDKSLVRFPKEHWDYSN